MLAGRVRWEGSMMLVFTTLWPICVGWVKIFQCTLKMAYLLIVLPPQNRESTGPSPLLKNWGTSSRTLCIILIMVIILIIDVN